jgi:hypothetical protein
MTALLALVISMGLALASFFYQRIGPAQGFVGTECGDPTDRCYGPVLNGGFPLPFVVDRPTVSVSNLLFVEDEIRILSFLIDMLFYLILYVVTRQIVVRQLKASGRLSSTQS